MSTRQITFLYYTGIPGDAFADVAATLEGSWDEEGRHSRDWSATPMERIASEDLGVAFRGSVEIDEQEAGVDFQWGVRFRMDGKSVWAITTETGSMEQRERFRSFRFDSAPRTEIYRLTQCRYLGANKERRTDGSVDMRFRVWAPNARNVELVFGTVWDADDPARTPLALNTGVRPDRIAGGYIADEGSGMHPGFEPIPLSKTEDGVWETPAGHAALGDPEAMYGRLYMYRVTRDDGSVVFRSDIYSRSQAGSGATDPHGAPYSGQLDELEGRVSCSVVIDPDTIVRTFDPPPGPQPAEAIACGEFWADEFTDRQLPRRVEDLIIYELHLGSLGFGSDRPGTLKDAFGMLDHIEALNVNAIELLPLSEFAGGAENWGYATSHYFAIEHGTGGRDQFKHFVKECHRRGLAVIMDVVYNHYDHNADRAERLFDSPLPENDIYYWYEGRSSDYEYLRERGWGDAWYRGGYIENDSTGDAPAFHREMVRKMLIDSGAVMVEEFHVEGYRVDQTTSIHQYNRVGATGREAGSANIFGAKFLREFGCTMRLLRPDLLLMAEDHSDWDEVIKPVETGGMGFDARWYSEYYQQLSGDTNAAGRAALLRSAATRGADSELRLDWFAGALWNSQFRKVVYSESHDEAGNSTGPFFDPTWEPGDEESKRRTSARTIDVAVDSAPLTGDTRKYAEARCRFAWGVTLLSAGTPMLLFGDEVGAQKRFKYNAVLENKENLHGLREGAGGKLYRFYSDANALRLRYTGLRSRNIDIVHVHNRNRVIAFRRWDEQESYLIFATLADRAYANGYIVGNGRIASGAWKEIFNSDSIHYGGDNVGNGGGTIPCHDGRIEVVLPFAGVVVLRYEGDSGE